MKKLILALGIFMFCVACQQGQKKITDPLSQAALYLTQGNPWRAYNILAQHQSEYVDQAGYWFLRGQAALRCGNLNEAVKSLEVAVSLSPKEPRYLVKLGYLYVITNCYDKATAVAKSLLEVDPENPYAHLILGQVEAFSGEFRQAQKDIEQALAQRPEDYQLYLDAGDLYLLLKDFEKAKEMYEKARTLKPTNPSVPLALANLYLLQKDYQKAESEIKTAIKLVQEKNLPVANYQAYLAEFYLRTGQPQKALAIYQELTQKEGANYFFALRLVEIALHLNQKTLAEETLSSLEKDFPELFEIPYLRGHLALLDGRYKDAVGFFSQAVSMAEDPRAYFYLGLAQWLSGFPQQARINLKKAVTKDPLLSEANLILAALELEENEPVLARATLLDLLPYDPRAHQLLLALNLQEGDCEGASREIAFLKKVGRNQPLLEEIYRLRCETREPAPRLPLQAWTIFRQEPEQLPKYVMAPRLYLGALQVALYWENGQPKKARQKLARLQGESPVVFYLRALEALKDGEREAAIVSLEKVVSRISFFEAEVLLGELYLEEEDFQSAAEAFRRALLLKPRDPLVLNNLAWTLVQLSEKEGKTLPEEAVTVAEKALEVAPDNPAVLDTVAMVYHLSGMKEVACRTWRKARELAPSNEIIARHHASWCPASP